MKEILEVIMLVCFGLSWPINLIKSLKAKTAKNISLSFNVLILIGYISGTASKLVSNSINYVLFFYLINLFMVGGNLLVYFRNRKFDKIKN